MFFYELAFFFELSQRFFYSLQTRSNYHLIDTGCHSHYKSASLSCKLGKEFDAYILSGRKWWCHLDDDVYLQVDNLMTYLSKLDWRQDFFGGRSPYDTPIGPYKYQGVEYSVQFLAGFAFCMSKTTAEKIQPLVGNGGLFKVSNSFSDKDVIRLTPLAS